MVYEKIGLDQQRSVYTNTSCSVIEWQRPMILHSVTSKGKAN